MSEVVIAHLSEAERDALERALRRADSAGLTEVVRLGLRNLAAERGVPPPVRASVEPGGRPTSKPKIRIGLRLADGERAWLESMRRPGESLSGVLRAGLAAWAASVGAKWPRAA